MKYYYPSFICKLLSKNNENDMGKIKLYNNFKKSKFIQETEDLENSRAAEMLNYFQEKNNKFTASQQEELNKYKVLSFTKNKETNPKVYNIGKGWSNAWRKIYEICERTAFIPNTNNIKHFEICIENDVAKREIILSEHALKLNYQL